VTDAHTQTEHLTLIYAYPAHEPRVGDVHYHVFNEARKRMKKLGALKCWVDNDDCDRVHPVELHHAHVEFALANIVDVAHFRQQYPEFAIPDDDAFLDWIESEGNLLPLCVTHHRGLLGIHTIHYPAWVLQRSMKTGVPVPEKKA
jgi:hypothetical protein